VSDEDPLERVVELGFLPREKATDAYRRYERATRDVNFASFLVEQGLIGLEQLAAIQPVRPGDETIYGITVTKVGQVFGGCRIDQKWGAGAMGSVYRAIREADGAVVVVKFLYPALASKPNSRARFVRTGELVRAVDHPNVAAVYSVHDEPDEPPFLVMELVDGEPLGDRLLRDGRLLDVNEVIAITRQVALGLAAAHARGMIHRDIKPDNLIVSPSGVVKLIDFGLAKNTQKDEGLSVAGQALGTPYYMAPEQWGQAGIDARSDLFSLGSTVYHMLTGGVPFDGKHPLDVARNIVAGNFVRPRDVLPNLPADLELVLLRMLETDPAFRYGDAEELAADLERLQEGKPPNLPRLESAGEPVLVRRFPLLPGKLFTVGRQSSNDLSLKHKTVSRIHAQIHRLASGYVLRDEGSSLGTFLRDMRVREAVLEEGDAIRFGEVRFIFHSGGGHRLSRDVRHIPEAFLEGLVAKGDRRTVLTLVEQLAPATRDARVAWARAAV
jgi:serine/threonine protein kinase